MDLFVVNRFWGEKNQELNQNVEEGSQIKNLLSRIEERKKRRLHKDETTTASSSVPEEVADETYSTKKIKRKKSKLSKQAVDWHFQDTAIENKAEVNVDLESSHVVSDNIPVVEDTSEISMTTRVKRKKRKSTNTSVNVHENSNIQVSEVMDSDVVNTNVDLSQDTTDNNPQLEDSLNKDKEPVFTVIGSDSIQSKLKAIHKLPSWLENPVVIPLDLDKKENLDHQFPLDQRLIQKLKDNKITHFFPVQEKVIPWLLKNNIRCLYHWPRDICVSAPTGSGKTLAFVLPIIQALIGRVVPSIRALIVLPVAELAKQVGAVFQQYCSELGLKVTVAVGGGTSFSKEHSLLVTTNELVGCQTDIMVTTPGRLVAHLRAYSRNSAVGNSCSSPSGSISLSHLQFLVIDEADRVVEGSQNDWLSHFMHHVELQAGLDSSLLPPSVSIIRKFNHHPRRPPQKLLFSATLSQDPEKLCALNLFQPKLFSTVPDRRENTSGELDGESAVTRYVTPKELSEEYVIVEGGEYEKPLVLLCLLHQRIQGGNVHKALVFSSSRQSAARLALLLSLMSFSDSPISLCHLSADLTIRDREKIMGDFARGSTNVLVSSDALARGVDVPKVDLVISYDPPRHLKNHIHRIGRTGRAGRHGCAITILTPNQLSPFSAMICGDSSMGSSSEITLDPDSLLCFRDKYEEALVQMQETLKEEQQKMASSKKRKRRPKKIVRNQ